jgi:fatty-acyl-CoA synthase
MSGAARSYSHGASSVPLSGVTIGAAFDATAERFPANDCVVSVHQSARLSYAQARDVTDRFARGLAALGIRAGDRVGIWSTNTIEWVIAQFATAKIGAILVNINPAFRLNELEYVLRQSGVSVILTQDQYKTSAYLAMIRELRPALSDLRDVVVIGDEVPRRSDELGWNDVLAKAQAFSADALAERLAEQQCDDAINIQYTSGTTGNPKGATLSHYNILNNGFFIGEGCRYTDRDRICIPVPFYHCFGMVIGNLAAITHGATMVIPAPTFVPGATLAAVEAERCTSLYGVPTMFIAELAEPDFARYDLSSLRTGIMAGSPCPVEVMKRVQAEMHMPEVTICYGMTETSPVSTQTSVDDPLDKRTATVGRVHPHIEVKIVDENGRVVPRGTPGELCTRGYSVMLGYWNDPAQTAKAIDPARYMHTGDIAIMDDAGYVNISGRIKDMVIRGGENIYPREVEEFLYAHPAIEDVAVIGVPDERYGEELCAWIIPHAGSQLDSDAVVSFCTGQIARFKIPEHVIFVEEFPMTVTGKIQKFKMRERSIEMLKLHAAAQIVTA